MQMLHKSSMKVKLDDKLHRWSTFKDFVEVSKGLTDIRLIVLMDTN